MNVFCYSWVSFSLKTRQLSGMMVHNYNSDTWEDEAGELMLVEG